MPPNIRPVHWGSSPVASRAIVDIASHAFVLPPRRAEEELRRNYGGRNEPRSPRRSREGPHCRRQPAYDRFRRESVAGSRYPEVEPCRLRAEAGLKSQILWRGGSLSGVYVKLHKVRKTFTDEQRLRKSLSLQIIRRPVCRDSQIGGYRSRAVFVRCRRTD